jgi:hypothetical protein
MGLSAIIADLIHTLRAPFDPYRPELHYMRGPGPKWRAKHQPVRETREPEGTGIPVLVRVKAR